ncbi:MAG: uroporphyrinogen decarboxylase family protein, partial [Chloroflexota bacterium]
MNHRERVLAALSHREPDRVPRYANLTPGVVEAFRQRTGHTDTDGYWGCDIAHVGFRRPDPLPDLMARFGRYYAHRDHEWFLDWNKADFPPEWGVATRPAHLWHLSAPVSPMLELSTVREIEEFPFPDYLGEWRHDHLEPEVRRLKAAGFFVDAHVGWIFQTAWTLRSEVKLFQDFYDSPEFAEALLGRIAAIRTAQAVRLTEAGVDSISLNDDIGAQKAMIISPAMWRQWLKPNMARLIAAIRRVNSTVHFRYHSDGYYVPVIPEMIEIGVTALRTVQPESMDVFEIKRRFGAALGLEGTIGLQSVLKHGTPDDVRAMIAEQCRGLMPGGGWLAAPSNGVTPD